MEEILILICIGVGFPLILSRVLPRIFFDKCPHCRGDITKESTFCPHCRREIEKN